MKSAAQDAKILDEFPTGAEVSLQSLREANRRVPALTPSGRSVPELFAHAVEVFSRESAVEFQGAVLSRCELDERSDWLAAWLLEQAPGPGFLVGIFMDRSIEMLVGMLGVMKAGAAYVPLDPAFPRARNELILSQTKVPFLLTLTRHLEALPQSDARVLCLDGDFRARNREAPSAAIFPDVLTEMRAYVIFTSGSTGQPKGVEVMHGSVVNLLRSAAELLEASPSDRLVAITTLAFDISVLELLLPLVSGGTLVLASKEEASDALRLKELLEDSGATMLQATPATFRSLLELGFEAPAGLKMMCGGEAWAPAMANKLLAGGGRLWNMYGPTETTVWSSIVEVHRGADRVTFGPPIAKTRFYVMDAESKAVPPGEKGELWIAGAGVARGYFERPELTAERFMPDPFAPGERMYRTGDEVKQTGEETIEFIGRLDSQVKLRGFRIELGEIEAKLLSVPGVRDAIAMLRKDADGDDFLATFYTGSASVDVEDLRRTLRRQLPEYMVPKVFARLEALPLTPNGKTDRKALAGVELASEAGIGQGSIGHGGDGQGENGQIENGQGENGQIERIAAEDASEGIEQRMHGIWQRLFPGAAIQNDASFFDLGGDSLLLVRLQSRIAGEFDLRLTMAEVTRNPTFGGLVEWAKDAISPAKRCACAKEANPAMLPLQSGGSGTPIFIIPQMLIFRTLAEELGQEQPFYALQLPDEDVSDGLAAASFEELALLYCKQIRRLQPEGPYRLGGWCLWGWMAYEIARRLEQEGAEIEMLAIIDAWAPGYWDRDSWVHRFFFNASHFWQRIRWYAGCMRGLPMQRRVADGVRRLREKFRAISRALPRGLRSELDVVETLRIQRFASEAAERYRPGPVKGNVLVFKSELRPTGPFVGEDMGWSAVLNRNVHLDALPGNHNELFNLPAARIMASRIREALGLSVTATPVKARRR